MVITCTPTIIRVINEVRREIVMSVEIDDGNGDVRTIVNTGKAKTQAEGKLLMDTIVHKYQGELAHEAMVVFIKQEMESDAKAYLEEQLNG